MTIKDIAELCGVSVSTVSRALNGHPDVSESVREHVQQIVREVHYVPNSSARDLVKSQQDVIGVVVRGLNNDFFSEVIRAIENRADAAGFTLLIHHIRSGEDELMAGAALARAKRLRGLIFLGGSFDYTQDQIEMLGVPFVCCTYTNSFGELDEGMYSSVTIDDRNEACNAVQVLIDHGHRKIAILLDSIDDRSISELRYMGYCSALKNNHIELDASLVVQANGFDMESAYKAVAALLKKGVPFTALFAISDSMAMAAIKALDDGGKRVPHDCSVIAIDGITMTQYTIPMLTTLEQPKEEMGEKAVKILLDMIAGRGGNCQVVLQTQLRNGDSVMQV